MAHAHHAHGTAHGGAGRGEDWSARRRLSQGRLRVVLALTLAYMVAEIIGGWMSGSLALMADAAHMFSDAAALGLSLFAGWIASRPATSRRTYGFYRAEILAALANGATLVALSILVVRAAIGRLSTPTPVDGSLMAWVALGGLLLNLAGLKLLQPSRGESLNLRGAWLHVASDALGSLGALVAGVLTWRLGWTWADPVASMLICVLVTWSSWALLKESVAVLMEGAPGHIDVDEVRLAMAAIDGVREVHDLHVWTITSGIEALSGHAVVATGHSRDAILHELRTMLEERFGIGHSTLQLEPESCDVEAHH